MHGEKMFWVILLWNNIWRHHCKFQATGPSCSYSGKHGVQLLQSDSSFSKYYSHTMEIELDCSLFWCHDCSRLLLRIRRYRMEYHRPSLLWSERIRMLSILLYSIQLHLLKKVCNVVELAATKLLIPTKLPIITMNCMYSTCHLLCIKTLWTHAILMQNQWRMMYMYINVL